jgi:hypothetical protein
MFLVSRSAVRRGCAMSPADRTPSALDIREAGKCDDSYDLSELRPLVDGRVLRDAQSIESTANDHNLFLNQFSRAYFPCILATWLLWFCGDSPRPDAAPVFVPYIDLPSFVRRKPLPSPNFFANAVP